MTLDEDSNGEPAEARTRPAPARAEGDSPIFAQTKIGTVPRPQEQLLIEALDLWEGPPPRRVLCTSQGFAQFAVAAAGKFPAAAVLCHWLDLYRAELARAHAADTQGHAQMPKNLTFDCSADFPGQRVDIAALPLSRQGESELTRELLQEAHERLELGGLFMASTDNPRDRWLHAEMNALFATVSRRNHPKGAVYLANKSGPLARRRNFACELAFRDRGRLIHLRTRPGVFSHRKVDPGARQLMAAMEIGPGDRVLDIGCGSGAVALAAAFRAEGVSVLAVDSHARAVECALWGARRNGLSNIAVEHSATGPQGADASFDVVAANPPYYAGFRIAQFFLETAFAALRPGGRVYVVSKHAEWYAEHMPLWFSDVAVEQSKGYWIRGARSRIPDRIDCRLSLSESRQSAMLRDHFVLDAAGAVAEIETGLRQGIVEFLRSDTLVFQRNQAPIDREAAVYVQPHADLPHAKLRIKPGHQVFEGEKLVVVAHREGLRNLDRRFHDNFPSVRRFGRCGGKRPGRIHSNKSVRCVNPLAVNPAQDCCGKPLD